MITNNWFSKMFQICLCNRIKEWKIIKLIEKEVKMGKVTTIQTYSITVE